MSPRATRRTLFLGLLLLAPLPMLGVYEAFVPVARYLLLAGVCLAMRIAEGPGGVVWQVFALFMGHALVYTGLLWVAAWLGARVLAPLSPSLRGAFVVGGLALAIVWTVASTPYVTPFGPSARANLPGVLR